MTITYQELLVKGFILRGLLTKPDGEFKNIVVMLHGYTGHKNENGYLFKKLSLELSELGYASLRFDFMGSGDSDGTYEDMTFLTELEDARHMIEKALEINKQKPIILLGFSMGGAVASRVSLEYQEHIEKLILMSPAGCMADHAKRTFTVNPVNSDGNVDLGGYYINQRFLESFNNIDMYQNIETFKKPVLIVHGSDDQAVPIEYGRKYHELYPNSQFYEINGAPHCYTKVPFRKQVNKIVEDFIKER